VTPDATLPTAVVFDLDGTLVDTTYLHALAWWRAARDGGHDVSFATFHHLIGMGGDELAEEALGGVDEAIAEGRAAHFRALHADVRALPGASALVRCVAERGARVVIGTSGEPDDVDHALEVLGVDDVLWGTVNSAEADDAKPAPEIFQLAVDRAESSAAWSVVVGDTVWDVEAGARAGLAVVGLLTGGHTEADLRGAGAVAVYRDPAHLLDQLTTSPLAALLDR
jgi:beta-phosphoglucomutase-like phosphatase (HAD superfamily)